VLLGTAVPPTVFFVLWEAFSGMPPPKGTPCLFVLMLIAVNGDRSGRAASLYVSTD
jgi:hypothetical protein